MKTIYAHTVRGLLGIVGACHELDVAGDDRHRVLQVVEHAGEHLPDAGESAVLLLLFPAAARHDRGGPVTAESGSPTSGAVEGCRP